MAARANSSRTGLATLVRRAVHPALRPVHADVALAGRSVQEMGDGSSVRVLVVGAETGKLAKSLMDCGASHVLVIDHSQVRHP